MNNRKSIIGYDIQNQLTISCFLLAYLVSKNLRLPPAVKRLADQPRQFIVRFGSRTGGPIKIPTKFENWSIMDNRLNRISFCGMHWCEDISKDLCCVPFNYRAKPCKVNFHSGRTNQHNIKIAVNFSGEFLRRISSGNFIRPNCSFLHPRGVAYEFHQIFELITHSNRPGKSDSNSCPEQLPAKNSIRLSTESNSSLHLFGMNHRDVVSVSGERNYVPYA